MRLGVSNLNEPQTNENVILTATGVNKTFGGVTRALIDFSMTIRKGEIHGFIGENGSGKSTFSSIIAGAQKADTGEIVYLGKPFEPKSMSYCQNNQICMIGQEACTFPNITVAYNVFAGNLEKFKKFGFLNEKALYKKANEVLEQIGAAEIKAEQSVNTLNFEDKKIVEIARAMFFDPNILIVDETTTALAQKGRTLLYNLMNKMRDQGKAVLFISHDLEEVCSICDAVTVMRDGVYIDTLVGDRITVSNMRNLMVGREMLEHYYREDYDSSCQDEVALAAHHVTLNNYVKNIDVELHKGEIVGFGGLAGSGMHEVGRLLAGLDKTLTGEVVIPAKNLKITNPVVAVKNGIGYISKDRDKEALVQDATIRDNIIMASYNELQKGGLITQKSEQKLTAEQIESLSIKCYSDTQFIKELSGGNKQKVAFAKWIAKNCDVLILDCPTRGIDIGVKAAMYDLIYKLKCDGKAILFISEELPELIGMSDRMLIFKDGKIVTQIMREERPTERSIIEHMV